MKKAHYEANDSGKRQDLGHVVMMRFSVACGLHAFCQSNVDRVDKTTAFLLLMCSIAPFTIFSRRVWGVDHDVAAILISDRLTFMADIAPGGESLKRALPG